MTSLTAKVTFSHEPAAIAHSPVHGSVDDAALRRRSSDTMDDEDVVTVARALQKTQLSFKMPPSDTISHQQQQVAAAPEKVQEQQPLVAKSHYVQPHSALLQRRHSQPCALTSVQAPQQLQHQQPQHQQPQHHPPHHHQPQHQQPQPQQPQHHQPLRHQMSLQQPPNTKPTSFAPPPPPNFTAYSTTPHKLSNAAGESGAPPSFKMQRLASSGGNMFKQMDKGNAGGSATGRNFGARSGTTVKEALLKWCQSKIMEYPIENFSSSWSDGLAFCALIHHFVPDAFDFNALDKRQRKHNFELAFRVAEERGDICALLEVEDMLIMGDRPDWKCVFTYVQQFYQRYKDVD